MVGVVSLDYLEEKEEREGLSEKGRRKVEKVSRKRERDTHVEIERRKGGRDGRMEEGRKELQAFLPPANLRLVSPAFQPGHKTGRTLLTHEQVQHMEEKKIHHTNGVENKVFQLPSLYPSPCPSLSLSTHLC